MLLLLLFLVVLILAIIFASSYIPSVGEFIERVSDGQFFVVGANREGDILNINVDANNGDSTTPITPSKTPGEPGESGDDIPDPSATQSPSSIQPAPKASLIGPEVMSSGEGEIINAPEVFLVQDNIYSYEEAEPLCKAYGARLATMGDLYDAWKKGGDWCSYGWVKGHKAVYPTQKLSWLKLQENEYTRLKCGMPGLNGGLVRDASARYGVHCYGVKPPTWQAYQGNNIAKENLSAIEQEMNSQTNYYRKRLNQYTVMPFSSNKWSTQYQTGFDR